MGCPIHWSEGEQKRVVAPLRVYDSRHEKLHVPPTVCLSHSMSPFKGASSGGQL